MQLQFKVRALRVLSLQEFISRAFEEFEAKKLYESSKESFQCKYVYVFEVLKGTTKWEVNRRLVDFKNLIKQLAIRKGYNAMAAFGMQGESPNLELLERLEHFIKKCLQDDMVKMDIMGFLEESGHNYEGVQKYKEILMLKKPGGRFSQYCSTCTSKIGIWKTRYFIIHNQGIIYKDNLNNPREYIFYDFDFKIVYGKKQTGHEFGITINSTQRQLRLKANNVFDFVEFVYFVKLGMVNSEYVSMNRFGSYAPLRNNCTIDFYIDGEEYFYHLANHMLHANKDIYITGWWVSPQFYLIRPLNKQNQKYRLDKILKQVADRGVTVRILVYHEPSVLTIDSAYTKSTLQKLSPNIKVIRHPVGVLQLLWSHHQKMVIIDQSVGFLGGLDVCYGRFDTSEHDLFDNEEEVMYPGIDYNNIRKIDICNVQQFDKSQYERDKPMLPWHDIQLLAKGPVVWDMSRHFIQYWNYASFQVEQNDRQIIAQEHGMFRKQFNKLEKRIQKGFEKFKDFSMNLKNKIWHKDHSPHQQKPASTTMMFDNYINTVKDHSDIDSSRFVQLNTNTQIMKQPSSTEFMENSHRLGQSLKKQYIQILDNVKKTRRNDTFQEVGEPVMKKMALARTFSFRNSLPITGRAQLSLDIKNWTFECQMVRSVGQWSIGCASSSTELSIQLAYIQIISKAKHYIYIQNQFFISSYADPTVVKNQIVHALAVRILKAYQNHEPFKVYIMLPLLPGFPGEVDQPDAKVLRLQMFWQYQTISRSKTSLFAQLTAHIPDPSRYIKFVGARTHGQQQKGAEPVTEIIYIHSKLMIVDDEYVICGSANINDRSMRGKRDSQLCMVCKDNDLITVPMGGVQTLVGKKIHAFRKRLFEQHFGFDTKQQIDPASDYIWNVITCTVRENTEFYRRVFSCYPDDSVHTFNELNDFKKKKNLELYEQMKYKLKGHAVEFPLNFLLKENLELRKMAKESFLPLEFAT